MICALASILKFAHQSSTNMERKMLLLTLSRRYALLTSWQTKVLDFELIKDLYANDVDFGQVWKACDKCAFSDFYRHEGFLFKKDKLCVLVCSIYLLEKLKEAT